jgi:hypothetical protein
LSEQEAESFYIECAKPYSFYRAPTKWFRYNACKELTHDRCSAFIDLYICKNCKSDDDIYYSKSGDWYDAVAVIALDNIYCGGMPKSWSSGLNSEKSYNYITKSCRQQAEVIQNHRNANVRNIGQGEPRHRKYKRLKLGGCQAYDRSSD